MRSLPLWMGALTVEILFYRLNVANWLMALFAILCLLAYMRWSWLTQTRRGQVVGASVATGFLALVAVVPLYQIQQGQREAINTVLDLHHLGYQAMILRSKERAGLIEPSAYVFGVFEHDRRVRQFVHDRLGPQFSERLVLTADVTASNADEVLFRNQVRVAEFAHEVLVEAGLGESSSSRLTTR